MNELAVDLRYHWFCAGVIDLNGRFFAGRHVRAGFYDQEKFTNGELDD